ncbi:MAG: glycerol kinase GlpK [Actinobacteria bacterium]|nr:glycerol kinase GlpK [Actinomycetota bacterium]
MKKAAEFIISLDQGTSSSRAILFDKSSSLLASHSKKFGQIYPSPGWVEHDPKEIWNSQKKSLTGLLKKIAVDLKEIKAIGITNQRETVLLWDRYTGRPLYNAIVWQCRRTADMCEQLKKEGLTDTIRKKTGLLIDPYFSGTKIKWLLDNVDGARQKAKNGQVCAGTVDSWLIYNLTAKKVHATDFSNASRTMLFNIKSLKWDRELLEILDIPENILPEVKPSSAHFGCLDKKILGKEIPISSAIGDQQAALFGQACFEKGMSKCTYGTGGFILANTGDKMIYSNNNLLTTIAWGLDGKIDYAIEGSIYIAGAAIQWLRDGLGIIKSSRQCDLLAEKVSDSGGVYFVPALAGLGAPYWDSFARGAFFGLTRGIKREHIVRATLEAIAFQVKDVLDVIRNDIGCSIETLRVDGGVSASNVMLSFQSDILGIKVIRPQITETTALGAAYLAGLNSGVWESKKDITMQWKADKEFLPAMDKEKVNIIYKGWKKAVKRSLGWVDKS